jgi:hypothetical protein
MSGSLSACPQSLEDQMWTGAGDNRIHAASNISNLVRTVGLPLVPANEVWNFSLTLSGTLHGRHYASDGTPGPSFCRRPPKADTL